MKLDLPPLIVLALAWITGVALGQTADPLTACVLLAALGALLLATQHLLATSLLTVALIVAAGLGWWRGLPTSAPELPVPPSGITAVRGVVADWPRLGEREQSARLRVTAIERAGQWQPMAMDLEARLPLQPRLTSGDEIEARGTVRSPDELTDSWLSGSLVRQRLAGQVIVRRFTLVEPHTPSGPATWRNQTMTMVLGALNRVLPAEIAAVAAGILVGERSGLSPALRAAFATTGTSHLLVVSGWNVALVVGAVAWLGVRLHVWRRPIGLVLALLAITSYTVLVGGDPAVVRAAIMGGLAVVALSVGRAADSLLSLFVAAAIMVGVAPTLIGDLGFQLSVLATLGLVLALPPLQPWLRGLPGLVRPLAESLVATLAAIIAVQPLLTHTFGVVSLIAPLASLLVAPWVPLIMLGGLSVTGLGLLGMLLTGEPYLPLASDLAGWATMLVTTPMLTTVAVGATLPLATVTIGSPPLAVTLVSYALLTLAALPLLTPAPLSAARGWLGQLRPMLPAAGLLGLAVAAGLIWQMVLR